MIPRTKMKAKKAAHPNNMMATYFMKLSSYPKVVFTYAATLVMLAVESEMVSGVVWRSPN